MAGTATQRHAHLEPVPAVVCTPDELSERADTPNYRQSLPTKVVEYLARGVPVVTTPNPQAAAIVRDARAGLVVAYDDVAATARALTWLLARDAAPQPPR